MKMISLYSTWWLKPENVEEAMPILQKLAKKVEDNEPDTLMYTVHTPIYDFPSPKEGESAIKSEPIARPGTVIFVEKYANWEAFEKHVYGEIFTSFVKEYGHFFVQNNEGSPFVQVLFMNQEYGFIRPELTSYPKKY